MARRDVLGGVVILGIWGLAAFITRIAALPLPTGVVGLLLLSGGLFSGLIRLCVIERAADFLLKHMMLFFIPAVVGVVAYTEQLQQFWLLVSVAMVVPFVAVLLITAFVAKTIPPTKEHRKEHPSP